MHADGNGTALGLGSGETLTVSVQDATIRDERGCWRRPIETDFEGNTLNGDNSRTTSAMSKP